MNIFITSFVRHALGYVAGGLMVKGYVDESMLDSGASAIAALLVLGWSFFEKKKAIANK